MKIEEYTCKCGHGYRQHRNYRDTDWSKRCQASKTRCECTQFDPDLTKWNWMKRDTPLDDKYVPEPNTGCWLWIAAVDSKGYGRLLDKYAHRVVYEKYVGPIPKGMHICHKCDTTMCVNPKHLFVGTVRDNMIDMVKKGRQGVKIKRSVIDEDKVRTIRRMAAEGKIMDRIAKELDMPPTTVRAIVKRTLWKHVA